MGEQRAATNLNGRRREGDTANPAAGRHGWSRPWLRAAALAAVVGLTSLAEAAAQEELYVSNEIGDAITVYVRDANGDVKPLRTISGDKTGLSAPGALAVDTIHNEIVVVNEGGSSDVGGSVTVYRRTDDGNVAPLRTISGDKTGLVGPEGLALDTVHNEIVVANNESITVYRRTDDGNVAPLRTISGDKTGLDDADGVAVDTLHDELVVTNAGGGAAGSGSVAVYRRVDAGNVAPLRTISGAATGLADPERVAIDTVHDEFVVANESGNSITVHRRTASGDDAPLRTISGAATGLDFPEGVAVDLLRNEIFVANTSDAQSVLVFSRTANNDALPLRTLKGGMTGLNEPVAVALSLSESGLPVGSAGCSDGVDNDGDGLIDCGDPDCRATAACAAHVPMLGSAGLVLAVLALVVVAATGFLKRRRIAMSRA